jgi:hypothetical protein
LKRLRHSPDRTEANVPAVEQFPRGQIARYPRFSRTQRLHNGRGSEVLHRFYQIGISEPPISPPWAERMATWWIIAVGGLALVQHNMASPDISCRRGGRFLPFLLVHA